MTDIRYIDDELDALWEQQSDLEDNYEDDTSDFDGDLVEVVNNQYPDWTLIRVINFNSRTMSEITEWLTDPVNSLGKYKIIGWSSGCSTSHGVVFERKLDAMLFKLSWC